jgi:excisionase family DNA binding protein
MAHTNTRPESQVPRHLKIALSVQDVAALCSISTPTVRRLVAEGVLPRVPHTERVLIPRSAVERWVEGAAA